MVAEIVGIKFGQSLPPERWMEAADNLEQVFPTIARRLELMNNDGMGKQDAREFMEDAMLSWWPCDLWRPTLRVLSVHRNSEENGRR